MTVIALSVAAYFAFGFYYGHRVYLWATKPPHYAPWQVDVAVCYGMIPCFWPFALGVMTLLQFMQPLSERNRFKWWGAP